MLQLQTYATRYAYCMPCMMPCVRPVLVAAMAHCCWQPANVDVTMATDHTNGMHAVRIALQ